MFEDEKTKKVYQQLVIEMLKNCAKNKESAKFLVKTMEDLSVQCVADEIKETLNGNNIKYSVSGTGIETAFKVHSRMSSGKYEKAIGEFCIAPFVKSVMVKDDGESVDFGIIVNPEYFVRKVLRSVELVLSLMVPFGNGLSPEELKEKVASMGRDVTIIEIDHDAESD